MWCKGDLTVTSTDELLFSSARSIARSIQAKEVSAVEVVDAHLRRIDEVNPKLNAVVKLAGDRAMAEASEADATLARGESLGPLHGVPITIKDSHDTEGIVSTGGTLGRKDFVPDADATAVARMREAGAIVLGKTNTPEFTLSFETDNLVYGQTNNPYDVSRTPGGSSGGAGAIIAAGGSAMDLGTDTGGSIRVPSAFCGLAGLKPTSGRVPRTGHIVPWGLGGMDSLTTIGPMARHVEDLWLGFSTIAGPDGIDPFIHPVPIGDPASIDIAGLRVAFYIDNGTVAPIPEVEAAVRSAAEAIAGCGCEVVEDIPSAITESGDSNVSGVLVADGGAGVRRLVDKAGTKQVHPMMSWFLDAEPISAAEYTALLEQMDAFRSRMLSFMENYDAILCPVRPWPALPHGETLTSEASPADYYTSAYNTTGWPGAVVRVGTSTEGLPISVQVMCRPWREDVAVALAAVLESALGGYVRPVL